METQLHLDILPQPDDTTCGPTCLQAVYRYYGDNIALMQVIEEIEQFAQGGTVAVFLACHALKRGYRATIYTYNLHVFDPSWFHGSPDVDLAAKLEDQLSQKGGARLKIVTEAYLQYLQLGGQLRFRDLTRDLLRKYLKRGIPILTGLSSTYLYRSMREIGPPWKDDDIRGVPEGHFVVLSGYDMGAKTVLVADPYLQNPMAGELIYPVNIDRVIGSILLGVLTHDANFLIIEPPLPKNR